MGRDRGKGKAGGRGHARGEKLHVANVEELQIRERSVREQQAARSKRRGDEEDTNEAGDDDEESGEEGEGEQPKQETVFGFVRDVTQKAGGEDEEDGGLTGRNVNKKGPIPVEGEDDEGGEGGLNRKQREALAAQKAREDYQKRYLAGETEEARRELARLAIVRARREEAKKKREAEGRAPGWTPEGVKSDDEEGSSSDEDKPATKAAGKVLTAEASAVQAKKKAAALAEEDEEAAAADGGPPKLKAMDIKKMNGDALKDHLKARGLDTQGQKKDLMKRLIDYEAARP